MAVISSYVRNKPTWIYEKKHKLSDASIMKKAFAKLLVLCAVSFIAP